MRVIAGRQHLGERLVLWLSHGEVPGVLDGKLVDGVLTTIYIRAKFLPTRSSVP